MVNEKGEAKATIGNIDFSFSLTYVYGICQITNKYNKVPFRGLTEVRLIILTTSCSQRHESDF